MFPKGYTCDVPDTFDHEISQPAPGLARANLLFARAIAYPDLRPSAYLAQLDDWAKTVQRRFNRADTALTRVGHLCDFLFGDLNLRGNREDYQDPRNSYLNEVMDRKTGLPITLAVVFVEVGERIGLRVDGIGLPGHFVVGVRAEAGMYYFDPFNGGGEVTVEECDRLVRQSTGYSGKFDPGWLDPTPPLAIIGRMLNNLRGVYVQRDLWPEALAVVEHLRIAQPEEPAHLRDLGLLHYRNHSPRRAIELLTEYLTRAPTAPDAPSVQQSLATIAGQYARLN